MKLLIDSGSTKTTWTCISQNEVLKTAHTEGINPYLQDVSTITQTIQQALQLDCPFVERVYFYGTGVTVESAAKIEQSFRQTCANLQFIESHSDIVAAARALCKNQRGIAGIIGTGSNSCVYDGNKVIANIGGFGYLLGDEGSGAILGKQLLSDFLYQDMPRTIYQQLIDIYQLNTDVIYENVYRKPFPNRYLASFALFLRNNLQDAYIQELIEFHFKQFFVKKITCYQQFYDYPLHFTGSVAYFFKTILERVAPYFDVSIGVVLQEPMEGLIDYHLNH